MGFLLNRNKGKIIFQKYLWNWFFFFLYRIQNTLGMFARSCSREENMVWWCNVKGGAFFFFAVLWTLGSARMHIHIVVKCWGRALAPWSPTPTQSCEMKEWSSCGSEHFWEVDLGEEGEEEQRTGCWRESRRKSQLCEYCTLCVSLIRSKTAERLPLPLAGEEWVHLYSTWIST